jgi:predicted DCC family thiol-disulfide oxidoreductase YuxK
MTDCAEINGWILYDADCRLCAGLAARFRPWLADRHFELLPLQTPWIRERLGLDDARLLAEMRLLRPDRTVFGGADALFEISRHYWPAWPIYQLGKSSAVRRGARVLYRWIARNRHCAGGACTLPAVKPAGRKRRILDALPLLILPWLAFAALPFLVPWVFMWVMAFALYAGCKWLTFREARRRGAPAGFSRALGYLLLWPGMDAETFLAAGRLGSKPRRLEWAAAALKMILGCVLLYEVAGRVVHAHPMLAGWIGMIGMVLLLHFGLFHALSLLWRSAGVPAAPIMKSPLLAESLGEFWGRRWNAAFNEIAFVHAYRPLCRLGSPLSAAVAVFALSGFVHELVISLPARGGYGLPTAYFLIQGLGIVAERHRFGRRLGLGRGLRGRIFAWLVTAGPAFWLFHPPFVHHVILPMFAAIGATEIPR